MKPVRSVLCLRWLVASTCLGPTAALACNQQVSACSQYTPTSLSQVVDGCGPPLVVDATDSVTVRNAAVALARDLAAIGGTAAPEVGTGPVQGRAMVLPGAFRQSPLIHRLISNKHSSVDGPAGQWEGAAIVLLAEIVADQRRIIANVIGRPLTATPQVLVFCKEVQDRHDRGMKVADDVNDCEVLRSAFRMTGETEWSRLPEKIDASAASDEATPPGEPSFTGASVGVACHEVAGGKLHADFDDSRNAEGAERSAGTQTELPHTIAAPLG